MDKAIKILVRIIIGILLIYIVYRNIMLRFIPSVDLIKDESTNFLYTKIQPNTANNEWKNYYYSHDNVKASEMDEQIKYNIAYKNLGSYSSTISEEEFKKKYESVFGPNTYHKTDSFIANCGTYKYSDSAKTYNNLLKKNCEKSNMTILSRIVNAKNSNNKMEIEVVIAYIDDNKKIVYKDCNKDMSKCSSIIKQDISESGFDEANLDLKKYDLHRYKFTYKEINNEFYFVESKKIK